MNLQTRTLAHLQTHTAQWLSWGITLLLVGVGVWYVAQKVSLAEIGQALAGANKGYILLSVGTMVATLCLKAWRWQTLLATRPPIPRFSTLFWAMMLGQYVNLVVPFLRLGEIARAYVLDRQAGAGKVRALSTVVVEKTLDMIFLVLTLAVLLPFIVLPDFVRQPGWVLAGVGGTAVFALYLLAFQTEWVTHLCQKIVQRLPGQFREKAMQMVVAGLEGLSALRSRRFTLVLVGQSAVIAFLAVLTPYFLFPALHISLGLVEAAFLNIVVTLVSTPPSTPVKIGVFNASAALVLYQFGLNNEAAIFSYSLLFHLVVILPQLAFGLLATFYTGWHFQLLRESHAKAQSR